MPNNSRPRTPDPALLLDWYGKAARRLPWRTPPGTNQVPDPYHVWLSEIMLQQTTVPAVIPYFHKFLERWPTVQALAAAPLEDVLTAWAGLGYYARARNLHACAQAVATQHGGNFPPTEAALRTLPGIGPYTAAAVAAIAFDARAVVVDGNVERVITRLYRIATLLPQARPEIRAATDALTPRERSGDFAQAMMDLGATICTPTSPRCPVCPWNAHCAANAAGDMTSYPRKASKATRPVRRGLAWWLESDGHVWLRRRAPKGLLGGMTEIPSTDWTSDFDRSAAQAMPPFGANWRTVSGTAVHVFTHFRLELEVVRATLPRRINLDSGFWHPISRLEDAGLPTALRKVADLVLKTRVSPT